MRRARLSYEGSWHHAMNRGYDGRSIFAEDEGKAHFIEILKKVSDQLKIPILAYCIMNTHYHLILQNLGNRMSAFFKRLNGEYATSFRKRKGGRGYVFQDRYHSMLIQDESYLQTAIAYVLNNPVKSGLSRNFLEYPWSSAADAFSSQDGAVVDKITFKVLFDQVQQFVDFVMIRTDIELPRVKTKMGKLIGGEVLGDFFEHHADRRTGEQSDERRRQKDYRLLPIEQVLMEFEHKIGHSLDEIDTHSHAGKRQRAGLLVLLKDLTGATFREIAQIPLYGDVSQGTLGSMYKYEKVKQHEKINK